MKPTAYLVNTARGPIVDPAALERALREGWIAGAALDVTDPEPLPPEHPLLGAPNLLVLPHLGSATHRTREAMAELAVDNLLAGLAGERMPRWSTPRSTSGRSASCRGPSRAARSSALSRLLDLEPIPASTAGVFVNWTSR